MSKATPTADFSLHDVSLCCFNIIRFGIVVPYQNNQNIA
jgi:hypothetical protein